MNIEFKPIGIIYSPYKEKFIVPRQPGLIQDGDGQLILLPPYNSADTVRGLEQFSHLWIMFIFHQHLNKQWKATVRPPRLGGNKRLGVFATRSTYRPNPIGLSLVKLQHIEFKSAQVILYLGSLDMIDGTPVIDIKPYLPYADNQPAATAGFAQYAPAQSLHVTFSEQALSQLTLYQQSYPNLKRFIIQLLEHDPHPAYHKENNEFKCYAAYLLEFNVHWQILGKTVNVFAIDEK